MKAVRYALFPAACKPPFLSVVIADLQESLTHTHHGKRVIAFLPGNSRGSSVDGGKSKPIEINIFLNQLAE